MMGHLEVFFNTKIINSGRLCQIGDLGLAPVRYWFHGKSAQVVKVEGASAPKVYYVCSFSENWAAYSHPHQLEISEYSMVKTIASIILLVPGLFLSIFKLAAYIFSDIRKNHALVKQTFVPINIHIGTPQSPITNQPDFQKELTKKTSELYRPINALIVNGNGHVQLNTPNICYISPKKVVLEGAKIEPRRGLDKVCEKDGDWLCNDQRELSPTDTFLKQTPASSIEEALDAPRPKRSWNEHYRMVFTVPRPSAVRV